MLQTRPVDVVITDLRMPGMKGDELLAECRAVFPEIPVIAITAFGSVQDAVALTRAGAAGYLEKPFATRALLDALEGALREGAPARERARQRREHAPVTVVTHHRTHTRRGERDGERLGSSESHLQSRRLCR